VNCQFTLAVGCLVILEMGALYAESLISWMGAAVDGHTCDRGGHAPLCDFGAGGAPGI